MSNTRAAYPRGRPWLSSTRWVISRLKVWLRCTGACFTRTEKGRAADDGRCGIRVLGGPGRVGCLRPEEVGWRVSGHPGVRSACWFIAGIFLPVGDVCSDRCVTYGDIQALGRVTKIVVPRHENGLFVGDPLNGGEVHRVIPT